MRNQRRRLGSSESNRKPIAYEPVGQKGDASLVEGAGEPPGDPCGGADATVREGVCMLGDSPGRRVVGGP
jgi:hypothetical protein